ncbi:MAG: Gldg family protein [Oscillospiraceae bacterium]
MSEEKNTAASAEAKTAKPKKAFNSKKLKYGSAATAITVIVIALVVLVNVIVTLAGKRTDLTIDLTSKGNFEISQESIDYINSITEPVEIVTMSSEDTFTDAGSVYYKQAYEVLKKYALNSDNITVKFVDMTADPTYANKYSEIYKGNIAANNIVVSSGKRIKVLTVNDLFNTEMNYQTFSNYIVSSKAEQALTSALMYVTDPAPKSAAIMDTGETDISNDSIRALLEDDGFDVSEFDPNGEDFPYDADIMVINAPINDLSEEVIEKLYNYLENDGNYGRNLIYLASFSQKATKNIDAFLAEWGIEVGNGVVGDENTSNLASTSTLYAIRNFIEENDYSGNVAQMDLPVISYFARPVNILFESSGNVTTHSLLKTADTSFVFTDEMQEAAQNGEEPQIVNGVYNTIALGSKYMFDKDNNSVTSNLLVYGSSVMLDSSFTGTSYYNNGDYFVSIVNAMTGKTGGISIVAKDLTAPTFDTTAAKANASFWVFVVLIPAAILITGIVIWLRRRHK